MSTEATLLASRGRSLPKIGSEMHTYMLASQDQPGPVMNYFVQVIGNA
jgi:hypothetical protein